ncbi:MAG: glycosyltransferase family 2 protein [Aureliella sp.]|jgi:undecaprenyl-phosphate 4-deoxy-4-formamido-L-arabinose transferase
MLFTPEQAEISIVIPVYNGAASIGEVVARVLKVFADQSVEIVLIDDGSADDSECVCRQLAEQSDGRIVFVQLSRNFGEHNAVLAGLAQTHAPMVAVLDDDGQNPPEELPQMIAEMQRRKLDVVYGQYVERQHSWSRRLGSWFNDRVANIMLCKPRGLYLSSFKVMNRFIVDEILKYAGPYPYIDGLICRSTSRLGQIPVKHAQRLAGRSNYTLPKLIKLWLNMFLGFSIIPLRITSLIGLVIAASSFLWLAIIIIDKLWITPGMTLGIPSVLACIVLFSGVQLAVMGMIGEYLGRVFLANNGQPQYIVRYAVRGARQP